MPLAAPVPLLTPAVPVLAVHPWPDPVIDLIGHDPRSAYVERFWLGILGPSATWLLRALVRQLEESPDGFDLRLDDAARALGLGGVGGRHSPFVRAITRCCQFGLAQAVGDRALAVRRKVPPLTRHQVGRLPATLQEAHRAWQEQALRRPDDDQLPERARQLALTLLELGEDVEAVEAQLLRWRFPPPVATAAAAWAAERHRSPAGEAREAGDASPAA